MWRDFLQWFYRGNCASRLIPLQGSWGGGRERSPFPQLSRANRTLKTVLSFPLLSQRFVILNQARFIDTWIIEVGPENFLSKLLTRVRKKTIELFNQLLRKGLNILEHRLINIIIIIVLIIISTIYDYLVWFFDGMIA